MPITSGEAPCQLPRNHPRAPARRREDQARRCPERFHLEVSSSPIPLAVLAPSGSVRMKLDGPIPGIAARIFSSMGRPTVTGATTTIDKIRIARGAQRERVVALGDIPLA